MKRRIPSWAGLGFVLAGLVLGGAACSSDDDGSSVDTGIEQPVEAPASEPSEDSDPAAETDPATDSGSSGDAETDAGDTESTDDEADTSTDESDS